jgi:hypothetical protein
VSEFLKAFAISIIIIAACALLIIGASAGGGAIGEYLAKGTDHAAFSPPARWPSSSA